MPKKHQNRALLTKPSSSVPSTLRSAKTPSTDKKDAFPKRCVNDLIRESRKQNGLDRTNIDIVASSSLHPSLRAVLNLPAPAPPQPRTHIRGPTRLRRIPGPPPPQSWLLDSQSAASNARDIFMQLRWLRARMQQQSSVLPGGHFPDQRSLQHFTLKAVATKWSWHAEFDHTWLSTLPINLRLALLSYLAIYDEAHWPNPLPLLFPADCEQEELQEVTRLDLANGIGSWTTIRKLDKELLHSKKPLEAGRSTRGKQSQPIPESWDDDSQENRAESTAVPEKLSSGLRFANLKHLSLALNPASSAAPPSWGDLIEMTTNLSTLTSLSLAHWPVPTYTPNASRGRVKIQNAALPSAPEVVFGGSDVYTSFDNNWREAAGILRSLSRNLYCLTWLDLSGCGSWLNALTWHDDDDDEDEGLGMVWNGSWRNIKTLNLAVGWLPGRPPLYEDDMSSLSHSTSSIDSTRAIEQLYGHSQSIQQSLSRLAHLRLGGTPHSVSDDDASLVPWNVEHEREKQYFRKDVARYMSQQEDAKNVARELRTIRKKSGGGWIEFDYGETLSEEYMRVDE